jgi:hypothetical protein
MPSPLTETRSPDELPQPVRLSDAQITCIMALARPLLPDQRNAFLEMVTAKLARCNGQVGDGVIYRLCRELQREMLVPLLDEPHHHHRGGKYGRD